MSTIQESKAKNNLKGLTIFILLFVVLKIAAIALYLFEPLLSVLAYMAGTIVLIAGIYIVSKSNNDLFPGIKVSILLVIAILFDFIATFLTVTYPAKLSSSGTFMDQVGHLDANFGNNTYFISWFVLFTAIFMAVGAHFFNEWFNDNLQSDKPFKLYNIFGILFFVASLIMIAGYVVLRQASKQILAGWTGASSQSINFATGMILFGTLILLIAFVVEIVAGIKIFLIAKSES